MQREAIKHTVESLPSRVMGVGSGGEGAVFLPPQPHAPPSKKKQPLQTLSLSGLSSVLSSQVIWCFFSLIPTNLESITEIL